MSDQNTPGQNENLSEEQKRRTEELPNGGTGPANADTASGGAPQDSGPNADRQTSPGEVDPDSGTDDDDQPVENPSGG